MCVTIVWGQVFSKNYTFWIYEILTEHWRRRGLGEYVLFPVVANLDCCDFAFFYCCPCGWRNVDICINSLDFAHSAHLRAVIHAILQCNIHTYMLIYAVTCFFLRFIAHFMLKCAILCRTAPNRCQFPGTGRGLTTNLMHSSM